MSQNQGTRRSNQLRRGALAAVAFSLIGMVALFRFSGGRNAWRELAKIDVRVLLIACGLVLLTWVIDAVRMKVLVSSLGGHLSLARGIRISILGAFVSNVTPFDSGGEPFQIYLLTSSDLTAGQSSAVVAVKTILNALARVTLGLAAVVMLLTTSSQWSLPTPVNIAMATGILIYVAIFSGFTYLLFKPEKISAVATPAVRNKITLRFFRPETLDAVLDRIDTELRAFRHALDEFMNYHKLALAEVLLLSFVCWISIISVPAVVLRGLGLRTPIVQIMAVTIVFYLAAAYAPTPGSSGAAELGFAVLFSTIAPRAVLGLFVTVWRLITYHFNLAVGGALMTLGVLKRDNRSQRRSPNTDESDVPPSPPSPPAASIS